MKKLLLKVTTIVADNLILEKGDPSKIVSKPVILDKTTGKILTARIVIPDLDNTKYSRLTEVAQVWYELTISSLKTLQSMLSHLYAALIEFKVATESVVSVNCTTSQNIIHTSLYVVYTEKKQSRQIQIIKQILVHPMALPHCLIWVTYVSK